MKMMRHKNKAFTLIELLVVVAIISALVAILSVAQRKVKILSKNLQQKAAFHAAEVSLGLFSGDFGEYPDSSLVTDGTVVTGAQRFAEAMLGRDMQGFHPKSLWHPAKEATAGLTLYDNAVVDTSKQRKPEYLEIKNSGFFRLDQLWAATPGIEPTPVITDVFLRNSAAGLDEKVGMPVLYFKADSTKRFRFDVTNAIHNPAPSVYRNWVYNFDDNLAILQLPWLRDPADPKESGPVEPHYPDEDNDGVADNFTQVFYELITARQDSNFYKPQNPDTFLLISAGYDGIYGTKDDLTNFDN